MAIITTIRLTANTESAQDMSNLLPSVGKHKTANAITDYLGALAGGLRLGTLDIQVNGGTTGVQASGTLTGSTVVAGNTAVIAGTTFTATASATPTALQFTVGANDTATMANLAAAINAHANMAGVVTATSSGAVVTVTAYPFGIAGNYLPLSATGAITASAATLTGGVNITYNTFRYGV